MNKVIFVANLVQNPEFKITQSGKEICKMRIAINDFNNTCFINVTCFDKLANICQKYLQKGSKIFLEGKLILNEYVNKEGKNISTYEVIANNIQFLNKIKETEQSGDDDGSNN